MENEHEHDYKQRILDLAEQAGGMLTAEDVLADAANPASVLHRHFEWDDSHAAIEYRKHQARKLIQSVKITFAHAPTVQVNALVSIQSDRNAGGGYRFAADVLTGPEKIRQEFLDEVRRKAAYWANQAKVFAPGKLAVIEQFASDMKAN
jgi:hypothetical protein